jgi:hypothetical protein
VTERDISPFEAQLRKNRQSDWRAFRAWQAALGAFALSILIPAGVGSLLNPHGSVVPLFAISAAIELGLGAFAVWLFRRSAKESFRRAFAVRWAIVSLIWAPLFGLAALGHAGF